MHVSECRKEQVRIEMIRHRGKSLRDGVVINASRLTLIAVAIVVSGAIASPQVSANALTVRQEARATVIAGHGHGNSGRISVRSGNGRHNKNYSTVLSPTVNRGLQQVSNTNVSGRTNTQVAFCRKKHRVCRISQKLWTSRW